jgi:pSer/pThr/pTyr-binding forkhead associated (FHA) protein
MQIQLTVVGGPHKGRVFTLEGHDLFVVGRSPDAHFSLPSKDPFVSRNHFLVEVNAPLCRLRDMGSHNGTMVNADKVREADLNDGDLIRVGETEILVECVRPTISQDYTRTLQQSQPSPTRLLPDTIPSDHSGSPSITISEQFVRRATSLPGTPTIPDYRITRELGHGGMGIVYHAVHGPSGEEVAVKTILPAVPPSEAEVEKFLREVSIQERLNHPRIVALRERGSNDGLIWFAMEYIDGSDAQFYIDERGPMPLGRAVDWALQLLGALQHAHEKGFVHRDVKPSNLLVTAKGGSEVVKLSDFGLARAYESSRMSGLTLTGTAGGTPKYMPPEQVLDMRTVKPPADQYSAAATLYYLLTAKPIFPKPQGYEQVFRQILQDDPIPIQSRRADLPSGLCTAIHKALSREPGKRFKDVAAFADAIRSFAG